MSSEELIKTLCARAIAAEGDDFAATADLHAALKAHIEFLRTMAAAALLKPVIPPSDLPQA